MSYHIAKLPRQIADLKMPFLLNLAYRIFLISFRYKFCLTPLCPQLNLAHKTILVEFDEGLLRIISIIDNTFDYYKFSTGLFIYFNFWFLSSLCNPSLFKMGKKLPFPS